MESFSPIYYPGAGAHDALYPVYGHYDGAQADAMAPWFVPVAVAPVAVPAAPAPAPRQSNYAGLDDWDKHQATITRLYLYEEKTLKEVKRYMEDNYSFLAT